MRDSVLFKGNRLTGCPGSCGEEFDVTAPIVSTTTGFASARRNARSLTGSRWEVQSGQCKISSWMGEARCSRFMIWVMRARVTQPLRANSA
jgi:hypothetical protein